MADNKQRSLLLQQEETPRPLFAAPPPRGQERAERDERAQSETAVAALPADVAAVNAEFAEQLQRLADTMPPHRHSRWATLEALGWIAALICLIGWTEVPLSIALGIIGMMAGKCKQLERSSLQAQTALDLARYDASWLGPLAVALESPRPALRPVAAQLLLRVLPMVSAADFANLDSYQRSCLHRRLIPNEEIDVTLAQAILASLTLAGDEESQRYVERLAHGMAPNSERMRLRAYAEVCEMRMRERFRREAQERSGAAIPAGEVKPEAAQQTTVTPQEQWAVTQVETQLKLLQEENRKRQQPGMRVGFLVASWCVIVPWCAAQTWQQIAEGNWPGAFGLALLTLLATQLHRFCLSSKQTEAARKLAQHDDVRGVGPLAEALEWPDPDMQHVAMRALTRLLPRLQATDAGLLNANQRGNIYRRLNSYQARFQPEFQLAILKALEQIGDEAAIPYVKRLANTVALGRQQQQVKRAAQDCLPFLRTRAAQLRVSQTLLRASSATVTTPDMLLRPADSGAASAPEQLLRAAEQSD